MNALSSSQKPHVAFPSNNQNQQEPLPPIHTWLPRLDSIQNPPSRSWTHLPPRHSGRSSLSFILNSSPNSEANSPPPPIEFEPNRSPSPSYYPGQPPIEEKMPWSNFRNTTSAPDTQFLPLSVGFTFHNEKGEIIGDPNNISPSRGLVFHVNGAMAPSETSSTDRSLSTGYVFHNRHGNQKVDSINDLLTLKCGKCGMFVGSTTKRILGCLNCRKNKTPPRHKT